MTDIMIGLPYPSAGLLTQTALDLSQKTMVSANAIHRSGRGLLRHSHRGREYGWYIPETCWGTLYALDSAGYTAMMHGGYKWDLSDYVEAVMRNFGHGDRPFPFVQWSAMDYCCEDNVAPDRGKVRERIDLTIETYYETLREFLYWVEEGVTDVPEPMPVLQGRRPEDYLECAQRMSLARDRAFGDCICYLSEPDEWCPSAWHVQPGLPTVVGVGSVCGRDLYGEEGLMNIVYALNEGLPPHVELHLFGVKGTALPQLPARVRSIDSMAWDDAASWALRERRSELVEETGCSWEDANKQIPSTVADRANHMVRWYQEQVRRLQDGNRD